MRIRMLGVAGAASLALVLTGCGGESGSKAADAAASSAPASPAAGAPSASAEPVKRTPAEAMAFVRGKLSANKSFRIKVETEAAGVTQTINASVSYGDPIAMSMVMPIPEEWVEEGDPTAPDEVEVRIVGGVMYMNMGPAAAAENDGVAWLKMDFSALAGEDGAQFNEMFTKSLGGQQDPAAQIAMLQKSGDIREVGPETVNGVATTRYSGTIDVARSLELTTDALDLTPAQLDQFRDAMKAIGASSMTIDLWIDEGGLPVKMSAVQKTTVAGEVRSTITYSDWGVPVNIVAPPAAETVDFAKLLEGDEEE